MAIHSYDICMICKKEVWMIRFIKLYICKTCNDKYLTFKNDDERRFYEIDLKNEFERTAEELQFHFDYLMRD